MSKSNRSLTLSLLVAGATGAAFGADAQTVASFEHTFTKTVKYEYLISLPTDYEKAPEKRWPVILFLHGSGERGTDPWRVAVHGPPKLIRGEPPATTPPTGATVPPPAPELPETKARRLEAARLLKEEFIVVSPQCPPGVWWDDDGVLALLDNIMAKHRTDPRRVYLTGLSMGGFATWGVAMKHPERFAAIVPICGGGQTRDIIRRSSDRDYVAALRSLGVRVFHGAKDTTVLPEESERMVALLKQSGVKDLQLTIDPEAGHDSWTKPYSDPELYTWLLQHERPAAAMTK